MSRIQIAITAIVAVMFAVFGTALTVEAQQAPTLSQQAAALVGFFVTSFVLVTEAIARFPRILANPAIRFANSVKRIAPSPRKGGKDHPMVRLVLAFVARFLASVFALALPLRRTVAAQSVASLRLQALTRHAARLARRNCWNSLRLDRWLRSKGVHIPKAAPKAVAKPIAKAAAKVEVAPAVKPAPAPAPAVEVAPVTEVAVEPIAKPIAKPVAKPVAKAAAKPAAKFPRVTKAQVFAAHIASEKAKQVTPVKPAPVGAKVVVTKTTLATRIEETVCSNAGKSFRSAKDSANIFLAMTAIEDAMKRTRQRELSRQRRNAVKASSPVVAVLAAAAPTFLGALEAAWSKSPTEVLMGPGFLFIAAILLVAVIVLGNVLGEKVEAKLESMRKPSEADCGPENCVGCGVGGFGSKGQFCNTCEADGTEFTMRGGYDRLYAGLPTPEGWSNFINEIGNDLVEAVSGILAEAYNGLNGEATSANNTTNASVKPGIILASTKHTGAPTPKENKMGNKKVRVATPGTFAAFLEEACATSPAADDSPGLLDGLVVADDDADVVKAAVAAKLVPIRVLQKGMTLYCTPEAKAVSVAALRFKGKTLGRIAKYADSYWISRVTARVVLPGKVLSLAVIAAWLEKFFDGLVLVRADVAKSMGLTAPMVARILTSEGLIKGMCVPLPARYFPAGVCIIASEVKTEWSATQSDYALCWIPGTAALTKEKAVMSLQSILMLLGAEVNSKEFFDLVKGYIEYAKTRLPDFLQGLEDEADDFLADNDEAAKVEDHRNGVLAKLLGAMRIPVLPFRMLSQNLVGTLSKNIEPGSMKIAPATEKGSDLWATYPMPILWPMLAAAWTAEGQHNEEVATKAKQTMELETKTADGRLIVYCTNFARWAKNNAFPGIAVFFRNPTGETSGTVAEIRELPEHLRIFIIGVNGRMVQMFTTVSEDTRVLLLQANEGMDYDDRCPTARGPLAKLIEKGLTWRAALAEKAKANEAKRKERNAHRAAMVAGIPNNKSLWNRLNAATILGQAFKVKTKSFVITSVEEPEIPVEATTEGMSHNSLYDAVMNMEENVFSKAIGIVANAKIFGMALAVGWVKLPDFLEELREEISETLLFSVMLSDIVDAAIKMVGYAEAWASYRMVQVYQVWLDLLTEGKAREGWAFVPAVLRKLSLGAKSLFVDPAKRVTVMDEDLQPLYENGMKVTAPLRDADGNIVTHLMAGELTSKVYTLWAEYRQWCVEEVEALANAQWTAGRQNVLHQTLTQWLGRREDEAVGEETLAWLYWNWDPGFKNLQAWVNQVLIHKIMAPAGYESNRRHKIVSAMLAGSNMSRGKKAMWLAYSAMPIRVAMASVSEEIHAFAMKNFDAEDQEAAHRMAWLAFANRYLQPAEKGKKHSKDNAVEALEIQITEDANGNLKVSGGIATTAFFVGGPWDYLVEWMENVGIGMVNDRDDSSMGEARQLALYLGKGSTPEVRADAEAMLASLKGGDLATMVDTKTSLGWGIDSLLTLPGIKISDGREANGFKGQLASISEIGRQIELRRINKAEVLRKAIDAVYAEAKKAKKPVNTAKLAQAEAELAYFHASTLAELADTFGFMDRLRELFPATAVKAEIVEADWLTEFNPDIKTKDENGNVVMGKTVAIGTRFAPQGKNAFLVLTFKSENHGPNGGSEEDLNGFFVNDDEDCEDCQDDTEESYVGDDSDYEVVDSPEDMPEPSEGDDFNFGDEDENFNPDQYGEDEEECVASDEEEESETPEADVAPVAEAEAEETEHFFVAFTGHRPDKIGGYNPQSEKRIWVREQIQAQLERGLAKHGEKLWVITGGALGVDQDAAEIAHEMGIPFSVFIPCAEQEAMWPREAKNRYFQMLEVASEIVEVGTKPYTEDKFCMQRRNMEMVDCADIVIAVWDGSDGGTKNAVDYAEESGVKIIFIDPNDFEAEVEEKPAPAPSEKKTAIASRLGRITGKK